MARTFRNPNVIPVPRLPKPLNKSRGGARNDKEDFLADYEEETDMFKETAPESLPPQAA